MDNARVCVYLLKTSGIVIPDRVINYFSEVQYGKFSFHAGKSQGIILYT